MRNHGIVIHFPKLLALMVLSLSAAASAWAEAPLRWKFKEGETLSYVLDRGTEGKINLTGAEITFKLNMIFDVTWKVASVAQDGTAHVEQTVDRMQVSMNSPLFGSMAYDSKKPEKPMGPVWSQLEPIVNGMLGQTFQMRITSAGKVTEIELPAKLAETFQKQQQRPAGNRQAAFGIGAQHVF